MSNQHTLIELEKQMLGQYCQLTTGKGALIRSKADAIELRRRGRVKQ